MIDEPSHERGEFQGRVGVYGIVPAKNGFSYYQLCLRNIFVFKNVLNSPRKARLNVWLNGANESFNVEFM